MENVGQVLSIQIVSSETFIGESNSTNLVSQHEVNIYMNIIIREAQIICHIDVQE